MSKGSLDIQCGIVENPLVCYTKCDSHNKMMDKHWGKLNMKTAFL